MYHFGSEYIADIFDILAVFILIIFSIFSILAVFILPIFTILAVYKLSMAWAKYALPKWKMIQSTYPDGNRKKSTICVVTYSTNLHRALYYMTSSL